MKLKELAEHINRLEEDTRPNWGKMSPQHMVEHLSMTLKIATGQLTIPCYTPDNHLARMRDFLMSNKAMPREVVSPAVGSDLPKLRKSSFKEAMEEFHEEFNRFDSYYQKNPEAVHTNPAFGELNQEEWEQFMKKHFTHHFEQFGLLDLPEDS